MDDTKLNASIKTSDLDQIQSSSAIPFSNFVLPCFPDNVWLIILGYLAADNTQNLLDLSTNLTGHPIGRIAQDFRFETLK